MAAQKVCVIGSGVAGLAVADSLAPYPIDVTLVDKNPYPGGQSVFYGCKAVDSCVKCGVCLVRDKMESLQSSGTGDLLLSSEPVSYERLDNGAHRIEIQSRQFGISGEACTECGRCMEVCPEGSITLLQGWKYFIDDTCTKCGKCVEACPVDAISLQESVTKKQIEADAVVVATGFTPFEPSINRKWGTGDNIITGSDLEHRFYDQEYTDTSWHEVAFVQCVGSRNLLEGTDTCSRVCCPYALRMANRLCAENQECTVDIYYMDIQRFGKAFEEFQDSLSDRINMIRSNPIIVNNGTNNKPNVRFEDPASLVCRDKSYDLVVLSNGICASDSSEEIANLIGIDIDSDGFLLEGKQNRGLFQAGSCKTPMRIHECVEDAVSISEQVIKYLDGRQ